MVLATISSAFIRASNSPLIVAAPKVAAESCCAPNTSSMSARSMRLAKSVNDQMLSRKMVNVMTAVRVISDCRKRRLKTMRRSFLGGVAGLLDVVGIVDYRA